ncbi:hypothetical protein CDD83_10058 [Cordyceps sp. RAO-2017]|nr:hypothetical protein CDD83_10058 [Cordyceps sp. RAO-2017]
MLSRAVAVLEELQPCTPRYLSTKRPGQGQGLSLTVARAAHALPPRTGQPVAPPARPGTTSAAAGLEYRPGTCRRDTARQRGRERHAAADGRQQTRRLSRRGKNSSPPADLPDRAGWLGACARHGLSHARTLARSHTHEALGRGAADVEVLSTAPRSSTPPPHQPQPPDTFHCSRAPPGGRCGTADPGTSPVPRPGPQTAPLRRVAARYRPPFCDIIASCFFRPHFFIRSLGLVPAGRPSLLPSPSPSLAASREPLFASLSFLVSLSLSRSLASQPLARRPARPRPATPPARTANRLLVPPPSPQTLSGRWPALRPSDVNNRVRSSLVARPAMSSVNPSSSSSSCSASASSPPARFFVFWPSLDRRPANWRLLDCRLLPCSESCWTGRACVASIGCLVLVAPQARRQIVDPRSKAALHPSCSSYTHTHLHTYTHAACVCTYIHNYSCIWPSPARSSSPARLPTDRSAASQARNATVHDVVHGALSLRLSLVSRWLPPRCPSAVTTPRPRLPPVLVLRPAAEPCGPSRLVPRALLTLP